MIGDQTLRQLVGWDENWYRERYPDIREACERGDLADPFLHYLGTGRYEGRYPCASAEADALAGREPQTSLDKAQVRLGDFLVPLTWPVKGEPSKTFLLNLTSGFFHRFLSGRVILDIGYKGGFEDAVPILPHAVGIDLDYPGYDGIRLPFEDGSVDAVFASHVIEHIADYGNAWRDWFRVLRTGGFILCFVPHHWLYEKKVRPPSRWNLDHKRFYTPGSLLREVEESLAPNSFRIRHLVDNDLGYVYDIPPEQHATGCYEIELVIEKIEPPRWDLS